MNASDIKAELYQAIRTLVAIPDRESAMLHVKSAWPATLREEAEVWAQAVSAGRYEDMKAPRVKPSPSEIDRMLPVLMWLVWLTERERSIIWCRAFDKPWWFIASRHQVTERAVAKWQQTAFERIEQKLARGDKPEIYKREVA